jgi:cellulose synthase operon protein C
MTRRAPAHRPALLTLTLALALTLANLLAGCAGPRRLPGDDQPTLASLPTRGPDLAADGARTANEEQTIAAYRQFLQVAPAAPQRPDALRRLGDLEMDRADRLSGDDKAADVPADTKPAVTAAVAGAAAIAGAPDYRAAVAQYREFLTNFPNDPRNDRVLYQLARAQEQSGNLEGALQTLTRLVTRYPGTVHAEEAHFRQGELLFTMSNYKAAEAAYAEVLRSDQRTPFYERALYMQGWSLFKQGRLEDALKPFFAVLDIKLGGLNIRERDEPDLADVRVLTRADRELVEDTFRVMSISLSNLRGEASVPPYISSRVREGYQFRIYQKLAELFIKQERTKDAADTFAAFVKRDPLAAQAPLLQARVIEIYEAGGLPSLALEAKKEHAVTYGAKSDFRRANPNGWERAQPLIKTHVIELAQHYHAQAQQNKAKADVEEAVRWYRTLLIDFDEEDSTPAQRYRLAELLYDNQRWEAAAVEFELVAYGRLRRLTPNKTLEADAGYFALLCYSELEKVAPSPSKRSEVVSRSIASAARFADAFTPDPRQAAVQVRSAEQLMAAGQGERASSVARQALALKPSPTPAERRTAWNVLALHSFDRGEFDVAEKALGEVLALAGEGTAGDGGLTASARAEVAERQAAAIYKQGELARNKGQTRTAAGHFDRISGLGTLAAGSSVRASALYDAAATFIALKDWPSAARALEDFRRQQPNHPLQAEVPAKLALTYLEIGRNADAAAEFERVAAALGKDTAKDPQLARSAWWQAAELYDKAADKAPTRAPQLAAAIKAYERYVQLYPQPLDTAVQARWRLAELHRQDAQAGKALAVMQALQQADGAGGAQRTARTRNLAALATLQLAEPQAEAYRKIALVEPLQRQLKLKRSKLEELQAVYAKATELADGSNPEVVTQATYLTAQLYQDFGRALLSSERPKKLKKAELEQYNVLLEEQAFPFEEKAIELHETNAARTAAPGNPIYDTHVKNSFTALAKLKPVRYGKTERIDASLPSDINNLRVALLANPRQPALLNQLGVAQRVAGRFDEARQSYETAITLDANAAAPQLNLAMLNDLYLGDTPRALALYQRALLLLPAEATQINRWLAELKARKTPPMKKPATPNAKDAL